MSPPTQKCQAGSGHDALYSQCAIAAGVGDDLLPDFDTPSSNSFHGQRSRRLSSVSSFTSLPQSSRYSTPATSVTHSEANLLSSTITTKPKLPKQVSFAIPIPINKMTAKPKSSQNIVQVNFAVLATKDRDNFSSPKPRWDFILPLHPKTSVREALLHIRDKVKYSFGGHIDDSNLQARDKDGHFFYGGELVSGELFSKETVFVLEGPSVKPLPKDTPKSEPKRRKTTPSTTSREMKKSKPKPKSEPRVTPSQRALLQAQGKWKSRGEEDGSEPRATPSQRTLLKAQGKRKPGERETEYEVTPSQVASLKAQGKRKSKEEEKPRLETTITRLSPSSSPSLFDSQVAIPDTPQAARSAPIPYPPNRTSSKRSQQRPKPTLADLVEPTELKSTSTSTSTVGPAAKHSPKETPIPPPSNRTSTSKPAAPPQPTSKPKTSPKSRADPYDIATVLSDDEDYSLNPRGFSRSTFTRKLGSAIATPSATGSDRSIDMGGTMAKPAEPPSSSWPDALPSSPTHHIAMVNAKAASEIAAAKSVPRSPSSKASVTSSTDDHVAGIASARAASLKATKRLPRAKNAVIDDSSDEGDDAVKKPLPSIQATRRRPRAQDFYSSDEDSDAMEKKLSVSIPASPQGDELLLWSAPPLRARQDPESDKDEDEAEDEAQEALVKNEPESDADIGHVVKASSDEAPLKNEMPSEHEAPVEDAENEEVGIEDVEDEDAEIEDDENKDVENEEEEDSPETEPSPSPSVSSPNLILPAEISPDRLLKAINVKRDIAVENLDLPFDLHSPSKATPRTLFNLGLKSRPTSRDIEFVDIHHTATEPETPSQSSQPATDPLNRTPPSAQPDKRASRKRKASESPDVDTARLEKKARKAAKKAAKAEKKRLRAEALAEIDEEKKRKAAEKAHREALELERIVSSPIKEEVVEDRYFDIGSMLDGGEDNDDSLSSKETGRPSWRKWSKTAFSESPRVKAQTSATDDADKENIISSTMPSRIPHDFAVLQAQLGIGQSRSAFHDMTHQQHRGWIQSKETGKAAKSSKSISRKTSRESIRRKTELDSDDEVEMHFDNCPENPSSAVETVLDSEDDQEEDVCDGPPEGTSSAIKAQLEANVVSEGVLMGWVDDSDDEAHNNPSKSPPRVTEALIDRADDSEAEAHSTSSKSPQVFSTAPEVFSSGRRRESLAPSPEELLKELTSSPRKKSKKSGRGGTEGRTTGEERKKRQKERRRRIRQKTQPGYHAQFNEWLKSGKEKGQGRA